jgi:hypothetical protein
MRASVGRANQLVAEEWHQPGDQQSARFRRRLTAFEVLINPEIVPHLFPKYSVETRLAGACQNKAGLTPNWCFRRSARVSANSRRSSEARVDGQGVAGSNPVSPTEKPPLTCGNAGQRRFVMCTRGRCSPLAPQLLGAHRRICSGPLVQTCARGTPMSLAPAIVRSGTAALDVVASLVQVRRCLERGGWSSPVGAWA